MMHISTHCSLQRHRLKQSGAVLVEFAAIVIALVTIFYGVIVYSIVFVTQQAVAYAAESGADAIVAVDPTDPAFDALAMSTATTRVTNLLSFLPGGETTAVSILVPPGSTNRQVTVTVNYDFTNWGFLVTGLFPHPGVLTGQGLVNTL